MIRRVNFKGCQNFQFSIHQFSILHFFRSLPVQKPFAMASFLKKHVILLGLLVAGNILPAQTPDTLVQMDEVLVTAGRLELSQVGNRQERLDSADLALHQRHNLVDVLALQSTIFIKNYGPSNSATSTLRGAASAHTPVLWNGFNLQSPMLGQVDLSLIPLQFTDELRIQYGGGSALWGSGPIGGAIHLNNRIQFGRGSSWRLGGSAGSFDNYRASGKISISNPRFINTSRVFLLSGRNDFEYERMTGDRRRLTNARNTQYGFLQENHFQLSDRQQLGIFAWYQRADRQLPPTTTQEDSRAGQQDDILRLMAHWSRQGSHIYWQTRLGAFRENLFYEDPAFSYSADNTAWTALAEAEGQWRPDAQNQLTFGLNNTWIDARSDSYTEDHQQNRTALFAAYRWNDAQARWRMVLSMRQEVVDGTFSPFVPSLGLERQLGAQWRLGASVSRNYRLPAMNDLYFFGGNPDLQAERGWSEELSLHWQKNFGNHQLSYQLTGFNRHVQNWIVWLPGEDFTIWSPRNIREVWSRGLENVLQWRATWHDWRLQTEVRYDYVRSTYEAVESGNEALLGQQLIYTPQHRLMVGSKVSFRSWSLNYYHQYTDPVLTRENDSRPLSQYQLGTLMAAYDRPRVQFFARVNNLLDENYQVIQFYPQPGRHFEVGFSLSGAARRK